MGIHHGSSDAGNLKRWYMMPRWFMRIKSVFSSTAKKHRGDLEIMSSTLTAMTKPVHHYIIMTKSIFRSMCRRRSSRFRQIGYVFCHMQCLSATIFHESNKASSSTLVRLSWWPNLTILSKSLIVCIMTNAVFPGEQSHVRSGESFGSWQYARHSNNESSFCVPSEHTKWSTPDKNVFALGGLRDEKGFFLLGVHEKFLSLLLIWIALNFPRWFPSISPSRTFSLTKWSFFRFLFLLPRRSST